MREGWHTLRRIERPWFPAVDYTYRHGMSILATKKVHPPSRQCFLGCSSVGKINLFKLVCIYPDTGYQSIYTYFTFRWVNHSQRERRPNTYPCAIVSLRKNIFQDTHSKNEQCAFIPVKGDDSEATISQQNTHKRNRRSKQKSTRPCIHFRGNSRSKLLGLVLIAVIAEGPPPSTILQSLGSTLALLLQF